MGEYLGVRKFCSLCKHGEINGKDVLCKNKDSTFYNQNTRSVLCAPCIDKKEIKEPIEVEYVGMGD